jgi:hypothetical protein
MNTDGEAENGKVKLENGKKKSQGNSRSLELFAFHANSIRDDKRSVDERRGW